MGDPSKIKNQINRTRANNAPAASSPKPMLDENKENGLRGDDQSSSGTTST